MPAKPGDKLNFDFINSLGQLHVDTTNGSWPVHDIDVQTGLMRIDVCGLLDVLHISEVLLFQDEAGGSHDPDSFYNEQLDAGL